MGSGESTTRKVSFGVDDEDRVRILRGVKLSEDVLQRMRGVANIAPDRTSSPASSPQTNTASSHSASSGSQSQQGPQQRAQPSSHSSKSASFSKEDQRRYEQQQKLLKEEWAKMAQREMEAAKEEMAKATSRERQQTRLEAERTKQLSADEIESMVQHLQKKDSQLKALDAFYKEQLAQLEKRVKHLHNHTTNT
ncbi:MICOS complex subunit mic25a-like [Pundamilia nyererei]|uniref:MICOS complex subunit mic25a-like n=1 Tax=Pundamilia nyererei TaxID=303518 RepID=A0A9Y6JH61_9CICH|nr:PREDICTED: MICOS complex subunit mic25a-like [Pundamilia nyererei]